MGGWAMFCSLAVNIKVVKKFVQSELFSLSLLLCWARAQILA